MVSNMNRNGRKKLKISDIGYHGKPIGSLTKKELQAALLEVVQHLYDYKLDYAPQNAHITEK